MRTNLDSLIERARAAQEAVAPLGHDFNQRVWRRIRMSNDPQRDQRWSFGLLLSGSACGFWCVVLAIGVGVAVGINEAKRLPDTKMTHRDLDVFSAASPSLPSSILHHQ